MVGTGDRAIGTAAARQRGLVHLEQLRAAEFSRSAVAWRVKRGSLYPVLPRVYSVGQPELQPLAPELAVLLWLGHDAVLSHRSAAWVWGLASEPPDEVDVTIIGRDARPREGIATYRVDELDGHDVRIRDGLPVTAPARTVIDFASRSAHGRLEQAIAEAQVLGLVSDRDVEHALSRVPTRAGSARIRATTGDDHAGGLTRSEAERRLLKLIRDAGLAAPETNAGLLGYEVDLLWRAQKLVVEFDGWATHGHRSAFERDRTRDQALVAAGYRVIRVTWRQLVQEPLVVLARIIQALGQEELPRPPAS